MGISDDIRRQNKIKSTKKSGTEKPLGPDEIRIRYSRKEDEEEISSLKQERSKIEDDFFADQSLDHQIYSHHSDKPESEEKELESPEQMPEARHETPRPQASEPKKGNPMTKWVILLVLVLIALLAWQNWSKISKYVGLSNTDSAKDDQLSNYNSSVSGTNYTDETTSGQDTTAPAASTSSTNTTAQTPTVDKSKIAIQVLNGNGITGSASKVKDQLVAAGFSVDSVTNAYKFTYQTTIIYYKTGQSTEADAVKQALADRQTELTDDDEIVGNYDVVVVVGKN